MTMKRTATQRLADGLVVLSCLLLLADMVLIFLLPALTYFHSGEPTFMTMAQLQATFAYDFDDGLGNLMRVILYEVWQSPETAVLALFSLGCAVGAAWIFSRESTSRPTWRTERASLLKMRCASAGRLWGASCWLWPPPGGPSGRSGSWAPRSRCCPARRY